MTKFTGPLGFGVELLTASSTWHLVLLTLQSCHSVSTRARLKKPCATIGLGTQSPRNLFFQAIWLPEDATMRFSVCKDSLEAVFVLRLVGSLDPLRRITALNRHWSVASVLTNQKETGHFVPRMHLGMHLEITASSVVRYHESNLSIAASPKITIQHPQHRALKAPG